MALLVRGWGAWLISAASTFSFAAFVVFRHAHIDASIVVGYGSGIILIAISPHLMAIYGKSVSSLLKIELPPHPVRWILIIGSIIASLFVANLMIAIDLFFKSGGFTDPNDFFMWLFMAMWVAWSYIIASPAVLDIHYVYDRTLKNAYHANIHPLHPDHSFGIAPHLQIARYSALIVATSTLLIPILVMIILGSNHIWFSILTLTLLVIMNAFVGIILRARVINYARQRLRSHADELYHEYSRYQLMFRNQGEQKKIQEHIMNIRMNLLDHRRARSELKIVNYVYQTITSVIFPTIIFSIEAILILK